MSRSAREWSRASARFAHARRLQIRHQQLQRPRAVDGRARDSWERSRLTRDRRSVHTDPPEPPLRRVFLCSGDASSNIVPARAGRETRIPGHARTRARPERGACSEGTRRKPDTDGRADQSGSARRRDRCLAPRQIFVPGGDEPRYFAVDGGLRANEARLFPRNRLARRHCERSETIQRRAETGRSMIGSLAFSSEADSVKRRYTIARPIPAPARIVDACWIASLRSQ
jgi:hypothetical protein